MKNIVSNRLCRFFAIIISSMNPQTARKLISGQLNLNFTLEPDNIEVQSTVPLKAGSDNKPIASTLAPIIENMKPNAANPANPSSQNPQPQINDLISFLIPVLKQMDDQDTKFDLFAAGKIPDRILSTIFNFLVKLSYALFLAGILVMASTSQNFRNSSADFINNSYNLGYIITIIVLSVMVYTFTEQFQNGNQLSPDARKMLNFLTDILRIATYAVLLVTAKLFIDHTQPDRLAPSAFWIFVTSYILFILRKLFKWYYYLIGTGKSDLLPWSVPLIADNAIQLIQQKVAQIGGSLIPIINGKPAVQNKKT